MMDTERYTPEEMAEMLRLIELPEGEVLDLLRELGETFGWTPELNRTGLLYLKPDAPYGQEREA